MLDCAKFVYLGLNKDKWPFINVETVQRILDDPTWLDDDSFSDRFVFYYDWWKRENES